MGYELKQSSFRGDLLEFPAILETLGEQAQMLGKLKYEFSVHSEAAEATMESVKQLEFDLLRYASGMFGRALEEAAREDCVHLIVASATDPAGEQKCQNAWKDWLLAARCWPELARSYWHDSVWRATARIVEKLKADGLDLDSPEGRDVVSSVRNLELRDLVAPDVYQEAFPDEATDGE